MLALSSKTYRLGFLFVTVLVSSLWLLSKDQEQPVEYLKNESLVTSVERLNAEFSLPLIPQGENQATAIKTLNPTTAVAGENPPQTVVQKASVQHEVSLPTPDELFERQQSQQLADIELAPTLPEREVLSEALKQLEYETDHQIISTNLAEEEALPHNPDEPYTPLIEIELPPSHDYKPVISFEMADMERQFDAQKHDVHAASNYNTEVLIDNPKTGEIYTTPLHEAPAIESTMNPSLE